MSTGYLTIMRIKGDPDELEGTYEQFSDALEEVGRDHGLILHAAAKSEDGLLVTNLWPSKQESEAASEDPRRLQALGQAQLDPSQIERQHYAVGNWYPGPGAKR